MERIVLINPNASTAATRLMTDIALAALPRPARVEGITAGRGPLMLTTEEELAASEQDVLKSAEQVIAAKDADGLIIAAYGSPGLDVLRGRGSLPVTGLSEAAMLEAGKDGRRFGVATTTPGLARSIADDAAKRGFAAPFTGVRLTRGDPLGLLQDPERMAEALALCVQACIESDGAEAVIIGGGPLGEAARTLAPRFAVPVVAPIPAAVRELIRQLDAARDRAKL